MRTTPYHSLHRTGTPPAEIITLSEAKQFLRVEHVTDDSLIEAAITAVRQFAEDYTGRSLATQEWELVYLDYLPARIWLPMPPAQSITSLVTEDNDGQATTISATQYRLVSAALVQLHTPIDAPLIRLTYMSGENSLNQSVMKQAMLAHLARCYEYRGEIAPLPPQVRELYDSRREVRL